MDYNPWTDNSQKTNKKTVNNINVNDAVSQFYKENDIESPNNRTKRNDQTTLTTNKSEMTSLTQKELIQRAFASAPDDDIHDEEFQKEKAKLHEENNPAEEEQTNPRGWGTWCGKGIKPKRPPKKKNTPAKIKVTKDSKLKNVIINEKRNKNVNFQISSIPYLYDTEADYERA